MSDNTREFDLTAPKPNLEALKEFLSKFQPAASFKDANHYFTTKEIHEQVEEHFGWEVYGVPDVVTVLKELQFIIDQVQGKGVCWMIK